MTDLPQQPVSTVGSQPEPVVPPVPSVPPSGAYSSGNKEIAGSISSTELPLKGVGQEVLLPKEMADVGVKVQPTTVPLPPQVANMGVQSVGANVPTAPTNGKTVTLPLTDAQIAQALHESVATSIRWLAEWCVRQVKLVHRTLNSRAES